MYDVCDGFDISTFTCEYCVIIKNKFVGHKKTEMTLHPKILYII